ncbi:MAG: helix-turn-helix transcriptional regulator [Pseudorhodoferax sp.]
MESIGSRVKWARELRGLTQAALAKAACVLTSSIADLEAGTRDRPRDLPSLAFALGVRPAWLETGEGEWKEARPGGDPLDHASGSGGASGRPRAATGVGDAIAELGALLATLSPLARAGIAPLLAQVAGNPALAAQAAQLADAIARADGLAPRTLEAQTPC